MEFYKTQRGGDICLHEAYEYLVSYRAKNGLITWRCRHHKELKCKSTMTTRGEELVKPPAEHSHPSDLGKAKARQIVSKMKLDGAQQMSSTRNILATNVTGVPDDAFR